MNDAQKPRYVQPFATFGLRGFHAHVEHQSKVEELTTKLAVAAAGVLADAASEVDRRADLFEQLRNASPRAGEHPRVAALESVLSDVYSGRFS